MFSAARILAIRKSKGLSQELLAEQSGVSLRTIQRVEQGETVPRGHTVQALAAALAVPLEALLLEAPRPAPASPAEVSAAAEAAAAPALAPSLAAEPAPLAGPAALRDDPQFLQLLNLSALCFLVFPFLNLVVPFLLWRQHRHDTAQVAELGRRILGFQMLWQVASFFTYMMALLLQAVLFHSFGVVLKGLFLVVLVLTYLANVVVVGHNQLLLRQGRLDVYRIRL